MTEVQVRAIEQIATAIAAFRGEHQQIVDGTTKLDPADTYDVAAVSGTLDGIDNSIAHLCSIAGDCT